MHTQKYYVYIQCGVLKKSYRTTQTRAKRGPTPTSLAAYGPKTIVKLPRLTNNKFIHARTAISQVHVNPQLPLSM